MNEDLNLCEILKGCEGIELWTSIFGTSKLLEVRKECIALSTLQGTAFLLSNKGTYGLYCEEHNGECLVFPAKNQRDWSKFVKPIPVDTPMMVATRDIGPWQLYYYANQDSDGRHYCFADGKDTEYADVRFSDTFYPYMIPFDKFNSKHPELSFKYNIQQSCK